MDDSEDNPGNLGLEETIPGSRNENFNYVMSKTGVNIDMIRVKDKIVFTVTHEIPYHVAVAIQLLEGCITQTIDDIEELKEKHSIDKY